MSAKLASKASKASTASQAKTQQLQIRVTAAEKAALRARAEAAGMDVSSYVMARALPAAADEFAGILRGLANERQRAAWFAELERLLLSLSESTFVPAVAHADFIDALDPVAQNLVAAFVEQRAAALGVSPPEWVFELELPAAPWFASDLKSLRPYLVASSPVPFRRRGLFVERGLGARV